MAATENDHFDQLKQRVSRTISSDVSEVCFNDLVEHFADLSVTESNEIQRIKETKDVNALLSLMEAQNQLSPNCVDNLEKLTKLADNPLATELVKQYKCYEKFEDTRRSNGTSTRNEPPRFDTNFNEQTTNCSISVTDAVPLPPSPANVQPRPKKLEMEHRQASFTKERQAAVDYLVYNLGSRHWKEVAFKLNIFDDRQILHIELENIDDECRHMRDKIRRMFNLWIEDQGKEATVRCLIGALRKANNVLLAEALEDGLHLGNLEYDDNEPKETFLPKREPVEG